MSLSLLTTQIGASSNYLPYLTGDPIKTDRYMDSDTLDFKLYQKDSSFVRLNRGSYITFNTATYGTWFSGYITSSPTLEYLGVDGSGNPAWGYTYQATSDDYLLNLQPLGFLPNYMNVTMGEILKSLITILAPGIFDLTNIGPGQLTAQYSVTPQSKFRDVLKEFCEASSYVFYAKNHKLYFVQQDSLPVSVTIDWNSKNFTPSALTLNPSAVPVVNQAFVLGDLEPQTYVNSYFIGDGLTGAFPLISDVFGADRFTLLNEDFSGSSVNNNVWNLNDPTNTSLQLYNGYLNCVGGSGTSNYSTNLQSVYPIPLEGNIRFTHGEWDFLETTTASTLSGVICGIWTNQNPDSTLSGCLYGLADGFDSMGSHVLNPIVSGIIDTSQVASIDETKRYVIRTLASFTNLNRLKNTYTYTNKSGVITAVNLTPKADTVAWQTTIIELDPLTGLVTNTTVFNNSDNALTSSQLYATYIPVASGNLHVTVTGITISVPIQAMLEQENIGDSGFTTQLIGPNEIDSLDNTAPVATIVQSNVSSNTKSSFSGKPSYVAGQASLTYFKDSTTLKSSTPALGTVIHLSYRAAGYALGKSSDNNSILTESQSWGDSGVRSLVKTDMNPRPRTSEECEAAAASIVGDNNYQHYEGTYNTYSMYVSSEPLAGSIIKFANVPATLPLIIAEEINQVVTTFVYGVSSEIFSHQVTFGKPDYVRKLIQSVYQPLGLYQPSDNAATPYGIDVSQVGSNFAVDVVAPVFTGYDKSFFYYDTNQPTLGAGFEVRYTDDSWGIDDGKNLMDRISDGPTFQVYRNTRSKVIFIKQYDIRNKILYSEDFTQPNWGTSGASLVKFLGDNPLGNTSQINSFNLNSGGSFYQSVGSSQAGTFSISVKGTFGNVIRVQVVNSGTPVSFKDVTLNGNWQRVSVYATNVTAVQVINLASTSQTLLVTFASFENNTSETIYCKTKATPWGSYSRFASAVQVAYPLKPNPPTTVVDTSNPASFAITIVPPILSADTWGLELRSAEGYGMGAVLGTPVLSGGHVVSIPVLDGGKYYTVPVSLEISGGGGDGATGTISTSGGVITGVTITDGGSNYSSSPSAVLSPTTYKVLYSEDIVNAAPPYTFQDDSPVEPYQYFSFTYNILKEYSFPGIEETEQNIPLNIVPSPGTVGVVTGSNFVDALYGNTQSNYVPQTFGALLNYGESADKIVLPILNITSVVPVNKYSVTENKPVIEDLVVEIDSLNGKLPGGHTYYVCVCGITSSGGFTPVSEMLSVYIPSSTNNCKIVIPKITIPDPSSMISGNIFIAKDNPQLLAKTNTFTLPTIISPNPTGNPEIVTSITSGVVFQMPLPNAISAPAPSMDKIRIKAKEIIHSGVAGAEVTFVSSFSIKSSQMIDLSGSPDNWAGSVISIITSNNGGNKVLNYLVTSFDASTGTFSTNPSGGQPQGNVGFGDVLIVRSNATISSSTTIGNSNFINSTNAHGGLTSNESGYLVRIIAGTGSGQVRKISSNTTTVYTVSEPFDITPDSTSFFIVEGYDWQYQQDSLAGLIYTKPSSSISINLPIDNYKNVVLLIMIQTVTSAGVESPEELSPISELFMTGSSGPIDAGGTGTPVAVVTILSAYATKDTN